MQQPERQQSIVVVDSRQPIPEGGKEGSPKTRSKEAATPALPRLPPRNTMRPPRTRAQNLAAAEAAAQSRSRFLEGSMNDRASAVPPRRLSRPGGAGGPGEARAGRGGGGWR